MSTTKFAFFFSWKQRLHVEKAPVKECDNHVAGGTALHWEGKHTLCEYNFAPNRAIPVGIFWTFICSNKSCPHESLSEQVSPCKQPLFGAEDSLFL